MTPRQLAAPQAAAAAGMLRGRVIERDLLARLDIAQGEEEHVTARDAAEAVRLTRVIDECRRVAAAARIDAPVLVELADADLAAFRYALGSFGVGDALA
jgi:hypothetical protein